MGTQKKDTFIGYLKRGIESAKGNVLELILLSIGLSVVFEICARLPINTDPLVLGIFTAGIIFLFNYGRDKYILNVIRGKDTEPLDDIIPSRREALRRLGAAILTFIFLALVVIGVLYASLYIVVIVDSIVYGLRSVAIRIEDSIVDMIIVIFNQIGNIVGGALIAFTPFLLAEYKNESIFKVVKGSLILGKRWFKVIAGFMVTQIAISSAIKWIVPEGIIFNAGLGLINSLLTIIIIFILAHVYSDAITKDEEDVKA